MPVMVLVVRLCELVRWDPVIPRVHVRSKKNSSGNRPKNQLLNIPNISAEGGGALSLPLRGHVRSQPEAPIEEERAAFVCYMTN